MARHIHPVEHLPNGGSGARVRIRFGHRGELDASITTAGLYAVGMLIIGALLGSAMIVRAAHRHGIARAIEHET